MHARRVSRPALIPVGSSGRSPGFAEIPGALFISPAGAGSIWPYPGVQLGLAPVDPVVCPFPPCLCVLVAAHGQPVVHLLSLCPVLLLDSSVGACVCDIIQVQCQ